MNVTWKVHAQGSMNEKKIVKTSKRVLTSPKTMDDTKLLTKWKEKKKDKSSKFLTFITID